MTTTLRLLPALALVLALPACKPAAETTAEPTATTPPPASAPADPIAGAADSMLAGAKVNLNTASEAAFLAIPEVTPKMAYEFDEYRPYASIQQFRQKMSKYVDDAQIARYEQYVYVPIHFDDCDAATLMQIPGVDAAFADELVAARPYENEDRFLTKLGEKLTQAQVGAAGAYLAE